MTWAQDQSIAYEAACACLTDAIAIVAAELHEAEAAAEAQAVQRLEAEIEALCRERDELRLDDDAQIARVRSVYGARVKQARGQ